MADGAFTIALGRTAEFYHRVKNGDPSTARFGLALLKAADSDDNLSAHETLASILVAVNIEADFTNYIRHVLAAFDLASIPSPDHGNHQWDFDLPDQVWADAGTPTDNALVKAILFYMPNSGGADSAFIPCRYYDFGFSTVRPSVALIFNAAGAWRESTT